MEYEPGKRYDPSTGQAQWFKGNNWQDVGTVKYDPHTGGITLNGQPLDMRVNAATFSPGNATVLPNIDQLRSMSMLAAQRSAQAQQQAGAATTQTAPSYWGAAAPQINMGGPSTSSGQAAGQPSGGTQTGSTPGATGAQGGGGGTSMATTTAEQIPTSVSLPQWQAWYSRNVGKTILVDGQQRTIGTDIQPNEMLQAFQSNKVDWPTPQIGGPGQAQPESVALQQMQQIDPTSEALRQGLGQSYLSNLAQTSAPSAADFQSLLNTYAQVDPTGAAARQKLGTDVASQEALGAQLDPGTIREVEQGTRAAQIARGNVYGTPQLVAETMARGSAGEQRMLQRQQALQSYLSSGQTMGDVAMNLYNQRQNQLRASQGAALGYLGSGQTPYQAGASYLNMAQQNAAMAAQGGPQYNPASLGQQYTGAGAPSFPQYGLDVSQLAGNWYNNINQANLQAYGLQQAYGQKSGGGSAMGAGIGALGGAASGALAGSAIPGIGTLIGAGIGAVGGAASGYFK
jgi:hypothetical protein